LPSGLLDLSPTTGTDLPLGPFWGDAELASEWYSKMTKEGVPIEERSATLRRVFGNWSLLP
jgi:hypothetical protein